MKRKELREARESYVEEEGEERDGGRRRGENESRHWALAADTLCFVNVISREVTRYMTIFGGGVCFMTWKYIQNVQASPNCGAILCLLLFICRLKARRALF